VKTGDNWVGHKVRQNATSRIFNLKKNFAPDLREREGKEKKGTGRNMNGWKERWEEQGRNFYSKSGGTGEFPPISSLSLPFFSPFHYLSFFQNMSQ